MTDFSNFENPIFSCIFQGQTAIINLKENAFQFYTNVSGMNLLLQCMNDIEVNENIRGVLLQATALKHNIEQNREFILKMKEESSSYAKEKGVTRYSNAAKRITMLLNQYSKPIVFALDGQVSIDSFGYFLACDYILSTEQLRVEFPGLALGVTPTGAVSFFLKRNLPEQLIFDLLLSGKTLSAEDALRLHLVNEVTTTEQLQAKALEKLESYYQVPEITLTMSKQLIRAKSHELEEHFENTSRIMWTSIMHH